MRSDKTGATGHGVDPEGQDGKASTRRHALHQVMRASAAATAALLGASGAHAAPSAKPAAGAMPALPDIKQLPLILRVADLPARTDAFYGDLKSSNDLQSRFITNPASILVKYFAPADAVKGIPAQRIANANRTLYSILANDDFRRWAQDYQAGLDKSGKFDKAQVERDFASAVIRFGDSALVQGLIEGSAGDGGPANLAICNINWVACAAFAVAVGFIVIVIVAMEKPSGGYTAADFRLLTEKLLARAKELDRSGALKESYL